jgi:hypothetical protein
VTEGTKTEGAATHDMRARTAGGLLAFADYLGLKGYQGKGAIKAWKIAITKVFETIGEDDWESMSLDGIDLDEVTLRFHTLTGNTYKAESVAVYRRRITNAMEAQAFFIENGRPPTFKKQPARAKKAEAEAPAATTPADVEADTPAPATPAPATPVAPLKTPPSAADFFEFRYPLSPGRMVTMQLPYAMSKREIDRLCAVLQTLEEQPQLPPGRESLAA